MVRKEIIGGGIAAVVIILVLVVVSSQDLMESEVVVKETKVADKPTDIVDFSAVQFGNELSLSMTIGDDIPITIDEIPLSDSAIGFAYGWFGDSNISGGHIEGRGSGHMQGYFVSMYHDSEDGWQVEPVDLDVVLVPKKWGADFCFNVRDRPAMLTMQNNTIFLDTPPDIKPQVNAFFVDHAASLELGSSTACHSRQIAASIIDMKTLE